MIKAKTNLAISDQASKNKLLAEINISLQRFQKWLADYGYAGYDLYDLWATGYGKWAKGVYHKQKLAGIPLVLPVFLADFVWPGIRHVFSDKKRYATADAHYALGFLENFHSTKDTTWQEKAMALGEDLLSYATKGYSGPCWGYPFDWQTNRGLWPKGTPFITTTPYAYQVFAKLHDLTGESRFAETCLGIAEFALKDLNKQSLPNGTVSTSYSPIDNTTVVNANAYRAALLADASERFGRKDMLEEARENCRFIVAAQREDGSWLYDVTNPLDGFIDNFHTCIVLKQLFYANRLLKQAEIEAAILRGYDFYLDNLIDETGCPKPFYHVGRMQLVKREMYDYAEGIHLGVLLAELHPQAERMAMQLAAQLITNYQTPEGSFITRELLLGKRISFPMPRWTQSQLFAALTSLRCFLEDGS